MGDIFTEYLVTKKTTVADTVKKLAVSIASILVCALLITLSGYTGIFRAFVIMLAIGALYLGWYLMNNLNLEFEIIVTNGSVDIDKIIARRDRKRLISVSCANFEAFGRYKPKTGIEKGYNTVIKACDSEYSDNVYYFGIRHPSKGNTLVVFSANDKVLSSMKPFVPRSIWTEEK